MRTSKDLNRDHRITLKTRILITGASGFLGRRLFDLLSPEAEVIGTYWQHQDHQLKLLDITNEKGVEEFFSNFQPQVVIDTVALSSPDYCEVNPDLAERINHIGTRNITEACKRIGARMNYFSTAFVFDGKKESPYDETDEPNPLNVYGKTKLEAENEVQKLNDFAIFRFDKMFGYNGIGKDNDLLGKILAGIELDMNATQLGQPLWIDDVVRAVARLNEQGDCGIFHLAGPQEMKRYDSWKRLAGLTGRESLIRPVDQQEQKVHRPQNVRLSTKKARLCGVEFTEFEDALNSIDRELNADLKEGRVNEEVRRS